MRSNITRRQLMRGIAAAVPMVMTASTTHGLTTGGDTLASEEEETDEPRPYPEGVLPHGVALTVRQRDQWTADART